MDCLLFTFSYCFGCENGYGHEQAVSEDLPGYPNVEGVYAECGEVTAQRGRLRGSWSAVCCEGPRGDTKVSQHRLPERCGVGGVVRSRKLISCFVGY